MALHGKNTEIGDWEDYATALIAGKMRSGRSPERESSSLYSLIRFWRFLFIVSLILVAYTLITIVYESATGKSLIGLFYELLGMTAEEPFAVLNPGELESWKTFYSGYGGMAQWIAGSLVLAHFWIGNMIRSSFGTVSRTWRFMKSHAGDLSERALSVPEASQIEKEIMLSTSFRGFWKKKANGFPLSPFGLRLLMTLLFSAVYAGLAYIGLLTNPLIQAGL